MPEPRTNKPQRVKPAVDVTEQKALRALCAEARVQRALASFARGHEALTALQTQIARIPTGDMCAPRRADALENELRDAGLTDLRRDAVGNVWAWARGRGASVKAGPGVVVVSAHLDTVFPALEDIRIEREGTILRGPGVSDDAAGLAALVFIARALREGGITPEHDIAFVCTVGEEGEGDLCGVKHVFAHELDVARVIAFLTLDLGSQRTLVNAALGSRRLKVSLRGPGGHSWADFGRPNPVHALARGLERFLESEHGQRGVSSFNVGTVEGGSGVNAIPEVATARIDLRATERAELERMERSLRTALGHGVERERAWSREGEMLSLEVEVIGDRPSGITPPETPVVRAAVAAFAHFGIEVGLASSSTDANEPMSRGVAALGLPHGVHARNAHSLEEWCDVRGRETVLSAVFATILRLAGVLTAPEPTR